MALAKISSVTGTAVHIPGDDLDTDRIIPARFMKCVTFDGLGEFMFYDVRNDPTTGLKTNHNLNDARFTGASIIISGNNFGCGSSREHAPQSIAKAGYRAILAEGFAEIFFGNSTNLGLPCLTAAKADLQRLAAAVNANPKLAVTVDVANERVAFGSDSIPAHIRPGARDSLVHGRWDPIGELLDASAAVGATAAKLGYA